MGAVLGADRRAPRLLDLFCGAGGAAVGYDRAGFTVTGVDLEPQPNFPYAFRYSDALEALRDREFASSFDAVHASPPCQAYSVATKAWNGRDDHPDLIPEVRSLLKLSGLPYVIENVVGAPLSSDAVRLCGSMFGLAVERHRLFETSFPLQRPSCRHHRQRELWPDGFPALRTGRDGKRARVVGVFGTGGGAAKDFGLWQWAMGIEWMRTKHELAESIPPAYTEWIGWQLRAHLTAP